MKQRQSQRQILEQMRAQAAWDCISQIKDESKERQHKDKDKSSLEKEYRSRVRSLNAMIQINGLGSTLGFLKAKSNENEVKRREEKPNAPYLLLEHLTRWMTARNFIRTGSDLSDIDKDDSDGADDTDEASDTENLEQDDSDGGGARNAATQAPEMNFKGHDGILRWVISEASRDQYRQATTECLAFGLWLRRFAEAELESTSPRESNAPQATEPEGQTETESGEGRTARNVEGTPQHG